MTLTATRSTTFPATGNDQAAETIFLSDDLLLGQDDGNDAEVEVPGPQTMLEDGSLTFDAGNLIALDGPNNGTHFVTLSIADGALFVSDPNVTITGSGTNLVTLQGSLKKINDALDGLQYVPPANAAGSRTLTVTSAKHQGDAPEDSDTVVINITQVNDAPSGADKSVTVVENGSYTFTIADFGLTDPADPPAGTALLNVIISTLPNNGTLTLNGNPVTAGQAVSAANIGSGLLVFTPDANEDGSPYASFTFRVQDNGGTANGGVDTDPTPNTFTFNVTDNPPPPNVAPVLNLHIAATLTYTENDAATVIAPGATLTDSDSSNFDGGSLTIAFTDHGTADDQLAIRNQGTGAGQIGVSGANVTYGGVVIGTFTGGANGTDLLVIFDADATPAAVQALVRNITYANSSDAPSTLTRTVTGTINDGDGGSVQGSATIDVVAVDDAAVARNDALVTDEATAINGNLFADNGNGADSDVDGPGLTVAAVNGSAANVGTQITLASGALLTVNANGTFNWDPNGAFDPTPAPDSGASNTPDTDSFTYRLTNGNIATVTIVVTGIDTADVLIGTSGDDVLHGGVLSDVLVGLGGNDILAGGTVTANELIGGPGNDIYFVETSGDTILEMAGQGTDTVLTGLPFYTIEGVANLERLIGTSDSGQILIGNDEDNTITGRGGDDHLFGGLGTDVLVGGGGNDRLSGGTGAANEVHGGTGNDTFIVNVVGDSLIELAGGGLDTVLTDLSFYQLRVNIERLIYTGTGDFTGIGTDEGNVLVGGSGSDVLVGGLGLDVLAGRDGDDRLIGGAGAANEVIGGSGDDTFVVSVAGDTLVEFAGGGTDTVETAMSAYHLRAANVENLTFTGTGNFSGLGNALDNVITGGAGNDLLAGGLGADTLIGGAGVDYHYFNSALGGGNVDRIEGFVHGLDRIVLDDAMFTGLATGALGAGAFALGTAAGDADDRIIYDAATGAIYFDQDGSGAGFAAVQFATLAPGTVLTGTDFAVI